MKFSEPQFEFVPGSERIRLIADWVVELEFNLKIIVPRGFETDGASVPRIFRNIMSPYGNLRYGAILHDFFYQHQYLLSPMESGAVFNIRSMRGITIAILAVKIIENADLFRAESARILGEQQKEIDLLNS